MDSPNKHMIRVGVIGMLRDHLSVLGKPNLDDQKTKDENGLSSAQI